LTFFKTSETRGIFLTSTSVITNIPGPHTSILENGWMFCLLWNDVYKWFIYLLFVSGWFIELVHSYFYHWVL